MIHIDGTGQSPCRSQEFNLAVSWEPGSTASCLVTAAPAKSGLERQSARPKVGHRGLVAAAVPGPP